MTPVVERETHAGTASVADGRAIARGGVADAAAEQPVGRRTPEEYQELRQAFYEAAVVAGRGRNVARAAANERLMRLRAEDEGRVVLGHGDIETYF